MEFAALVPEAFLASAKSTEVFDSLWDYTVVELEVDAADFGWQTWQSAWISSSKNVVENTGSTNNNDLGEEAGKMTGRQKEGGGDLRLTWLTVCGSVLDVEVRSDAHLRGG